MTAVMVLLFTSLSRFMDSLSFSFDISEKSFTIFVLEMLLIEALIAGF